MNIEKWKELKDKIETKFGTFETERENDYLEDDIGNKIPQVSESLIFNSPMGRIKITRTSHPKIVERRPHYHKGAGGAAIEFITEEGEESSQMVVYKEDYGDWVKIDLPPEKISL